MQPSAHEIQKKIASLPLNVKNAIEHFNWAEKVMEIGRSQGLHLDDIENFRKQTLLVIIGMLPAEKYERVLSQHLNVKSDVIDFLVEQANQHIFKELQGLAFKEDEEEEENTEVKEIPMEHNDPYHEPLEPEDIRGVFQREGIELLDDDEAQAFPSRNDISETSDDIDTALLSSTEEQEDALSSSDSLPVSHYQELIDPDDLSGIAEHRIDTEILSSRKQVDSEQPSFQEEFQSENSLVHKKSGTFAERFDQHLMENPFMAKGDILNLSPHEEEEEFETESFLQKLGTKKNDPLS